MQSADVIIQVSIVSAIAVCTLFVILLVRRWWLDRSASVRRAALGQITRTYLQRVSGTKVEDTNPRWSAGLKLSAIAHMHLLLRGGERQRLMQLAELDGLLESTIRRSHHRRAARRIDSIRLLQQFGSEACIARLRQMLTRDRHPKVRLEAAFALAALYALPPPRELFRILGITSREPNRLDHALLRSVAPIYADHLEVMLKEGLSHPYRALVIDALGFTQDPNILATLESAVRSDNAEERAAALRAAAQVGYPSRSGWVEPLIDDPVAFVRVQAINCCAALGLSSAVPRLQARLQDEELWVRLRSEHALDVLLANWPHDQTQAVA